MAAGPALEMAYRRLRRGPSVSAGDVVVTPVVLEHRAAGIAACGPWVVAAKRPVAVIVAGPDGRRLLRLDDAEGLIDDC